MILITGEKGFLGRHIRRHFEKKGLEIFPNNKEEDRRRKWMGLDVNDLSTLPTVGTDIEAVIHLAAKTSINNSICEPQDTFYTNLLGTLNLLELARQNKVPKFVYMSTYVYGQPKYFPVDENHPVDPGTPYHVSKYLAEQLCESFSKNYGMNIVALRPFHIYGSQPRPGSFLYCVLEQILKKDGNVVLSGKLTRRDFLFVDDFVNLVDLIINKFPKGYNVYNVGYGKSYLLSDVAQLMSELLSKKININYDAQMRPGDITDIVADITKVSNMFAWIPKTSLKLGLNKVIKTLDLNSILDENRVLE